MKNDRIQDFVSKYGMLGLVIGLIAFFGGIALAYFTNDADPYGTIGGVVCALGLILTLYTVSARKKE